jgi:hypothetical protein
MAEKNDGVTVNTSATSYDGWSWKEIEIAIVGGIDMSQTDQNRELAVTSDPNSAMYAAIYFYNAQGALKEIQTGLEDLGKSVKNTWKGKGSEAFTKMLKGVQGALQPVMDAVVGEGTGAPAYFETLSNTHNSLSTAITDVLAADNKGATDTINRWYQDVRDHMNDTIWLIKNFDYPPWHQEPDGTYVVAVSTYPDIVETMTNSMRTTINKLASEYKTYSGDLRDPGNPTFDTGGDNSGDNNKPPTFKPPTYKPPTFKPPTFNTPKTPDVPDLGGLDTPKLDGSALGTPDLGGVDGLNPPGLNGLTGADNNGLLGPGGLNGNLDPTKLANGNLKLPPNANGNLKLPPTSNLKLPPASNLKPPTSNLKLPPLSNLKLPPNPNLGLGGLGGGLGGLNGLKFPNQAGLRNSLRMPNLSQLRSSLPPSLRSKLAGLNVPGENSVLRSGTGTSQAALAAAAARKALQAEQNVLSAGRGAVGGPGGMPYLPPMGAGGGQRGRKEDERDRNTWLQEDEDVWGTAPQVGPAFLDGSSPG